MQIPLLDVAAQVSRHKIAAVGMKRDVVDVARVPLELAGEGEVGEIPKLDEIIVAAGRELGAVGANDHRPHPAGMRVDDAIGLWEGGVGGPDQHLTVVIAAEQLAIRPMKRQATHPAAMAGKRDLCLVGHFPALNGTVLRPSEDKAARRIKAARQERAVVPKLQGYPGA